MRDRFQDPHQAWIGLGANLGSRRQTLRVAQAELTTLSGRPTVASALYESEPWGVEGQPPYLNGVLGLDWRGTPETLLAALHTIEDAHGRTRDEKWGSRTLDLDLLCFGALRVESATLTLPHPRLHLRRFVLMPWAEIAPTWVVPGHGVVADLLAGCSDTRWVRPRGSWC